MRRTSSSTMVACGAVVVLLAQCAAAAESAGRSSQATARAVEERTKSVSHLQLTSSDVTSPAKAIIAADLVDAHDPAGVRATDGRAAEITECRAIIRRCELSVRGIEALIRDLLPGPERHALQLRARVAKRQMYIELLRVHEKHAFMRGDMVATEAARRAIETLLAPKPSVSVSTVQKPAHANRKGGTR